MYNILLTLLVDLCIGGAGAAVLILITGQWDRWAADRCLSSQPLQAAFYQSPRDLKALKEFHDFCGIGSTGQGIHKAGSACYSGHF